MPNSAYILYYMLLWVQPLLSALPTSIGSRSIGGWKGRIFVACLKETLSPVD